MPLRTDRVVCPPGSVPHPHRSKHLFRKMFGQTTTRLRTDCNRSWTNLMNRNRRKPVKENTVAFWWQNSDLVRQFHTAVCLHGHTDRKSTRLNSSHLGIS